MFLLFGLMLIEILKISYSFSLSQMIQPGLANLFHGNDLLKSTQAAIHKNDFEQMKASILEGFYLHVNDMGKELTKMNGEWNATGELGQQSALISSFVTFVRKLNLPLKSLGKLEIEKIPVFVNKKSKTKKPANHSVRGHNFTEYSFLTVKPVCSKCNMPFWGIGYQGLICQSKILVIFKKMTIDRVFNNWLYF
jgi:hypothetical protein